MESRNDTPELVVLVGIPGSGKSTIRREYEKGDCVILSSDDIRESLAAEAKIDPCDRAAYLALNDRVFTKMRTEAKEALRRGTSVVYDATNLNRKKRISLLREVGGIPCRKKCLLFITPRDVCIERDSRREGVARVGKRVINRMLRSFECPWYGEGWDSIEPVICRERYAFPFEETYGLSQDNPHHTRTLYGHLSAALEYSAEHGYPEHLREAALYHDVGKLYTKEFKNYKGEPTDTAHYYGHENYSAYLYLTEKCCGKETDENDFGKILYNTLLINLHMRPLNAWSASSAAEEKDVKIFGEKLIADVRLLHEADRAAH